MRGGAGRHAAGIAASALLLALYARWPQAWPLGAFVLVPWCLALDDGRGLRGAVVSGAAMALAFVAVVFGWFGAAIAGYVGLGTASATAVLLVLAPLLQPQLLAYAAVRHIAGLRYGAGMRALAAAAAWVACEALWPKLFGDTLGHGLHGARTLRQAADLGGAAGLTVLLLLVNEAIACALARRRGGSRAWATPLLAGVLLVAGTAAYGAVRLASLQARPAAEAAPLRVAMVQASITDYERLRREMGAYAVVRHVLDTHYALSWSALRDHDADVLLWSETVYPTTFGTPRSEDGALLDAEIRAFVETAGVPLVFGSYDRDADGEYNAAMFVEPGRGLIGAYRKTHPFPLTEHVPRWLDGPRLRAWLPWAGSWQPGNGARVMPLRSRDGRELNVVPLICLDDVHPQLAIDGARLGAEAILGMSNDSWFTGHPQGARLHLAVAGFRSIETRLPQVRVTTNGLSAVIDETGEVQVRTAMGDEAVLTATVHPQAPVTTLMVRWGDWVGRAGAAFLLVLALAGMRTRPRSDDARVPVAIEGHLMPPPVRALDAGLRLLAGAGLAWLAVDMLLRTGPQVASLVQLQVFAGMVVLPWLAAGLLRVATAAGIAPDGDGRVLVARGRRIDLPAATTTLRPWRLPWPCAGVDLETGGDERRPYAMALRGPHRVQRLVDAAGSECLVDRRHPVLARFADARDAGRRRWDHPLLKFGAFPLLPALVAFRLHQIIAFGGPLGEWQTFGAGAWWTALAIWWASWSLGLVLFAAALRVLLEAICLATTWRCPAGAHALRGGLEHAARLVYYLGVPLWLAWRLSPGAG
ncbi:apolipoprotein N-acyltransferase [Luteimonas sp. SJ-16]|uniref:Apolipoprotein N-acyltransferase n=2 Tax=Luteimonas deserti TaxID=2752306 RepID=A0A7Z0QPQ8_9GAMM|nr:apolipoprotein N-acyltransferase [Luteimonas deserti]